MIPFMLLPNARAPQRAHAGDAAVDLFACFETPGHLIKLFPKQRVLIGTGVYVAIPFGFYGQIAPRSGLAFSDGIDVLGGVIDSGYRGEVKVILINHGPSYFEIAHHSKIAQMIVKPIDTSDWVEVETLAPYGDPPRDKSGFGSTGR